MTMIRYNIQTGANGSVLIPTTPFADGKEIEVVLRERHRESLPPDDGWRPDPAVVRQFFESRTMTAPDLTDEEIERLKHERRMRKMK